MKANAPEKIWIDPTSDLPKLSGHIDKDSVEYTRTDAFIEKACEFFEEHLCCYIEAQDFIIEEERLENDFKRYMEE